MITGLPSSQQAFEMTRSPYHWPELRPTVASHKPFSVVAFDMAESKGRCYVAVVLRVDDTLEMVPKAAGVPLLAIQGFGVLANPGMASLRRNVIAYRL